MEIHQAINSKQAIKSINLFLFFFDVIVFKKNFWEYKQRNAHPDGQIPGHSRNVSCEDRAQEKPEMPHSKLDLPNMHKKMEHHKIAQVVKNLQWVMRELRNTNHFSASPNLDCS